jgi:hypothetical protein
LKVPGFFRPFWPYTPSVKQLTPAELDSLHIALSETVFGPNEEVLKQSRPMVRVRLSGFPQREVRMKKLIFALATGLIAAIASYYGVSASTAVADPCNGSKFFC